MTIRQLHAPPSHEALREHMRQRAENVQNRIADAITAFAGSMVFIYIHIALFATWMLVFEESRGRRSRSRSRSRRSSCRRS